MTENQSNPDTKTVEPVLSYTTFFPGRGPDGKPDDSALRGISLARRKSTWPQIVAAIRSVGKAATKKGLPLIKLAEFGNNATHKGSLRHDANIVAVSGVEGDYDGGQVPLEQAAATLRDAGITAFLYTTPSHTPECPRWRVLSPLSTTCSRGERARHVAKLNGVLGGILAPESFVPSQAFFMGKVEGVEYRDVLVDGSPLDQVETRTGLLYADTGSKGTKSKSSPSTEPDFARELAIDRVTEETLSDLRSALGVNPATSKPYIDPDDRVTWVAMAHALKCLGDDGRELWLAWSALSLKFEDGADDPTKVWDSCEGSRSDYRAVFKRAAAGGWLNPKSAEAIKANATAATRVDWTDSGNVAVMAQMLDGNLRWVPERKVWLFWTGERWEMDPQGARAMAAAKQVGEHYYKEAAKLRQQAKADSLDDAGRKYVEKAAKGVESWAQRCRSKGALDNMLGLAKADARFVLPADKLDTNRLLLGVNNGVVDLRVGTLREASRDEYVTRRSPVAFIPEAAAPRWEQFITEITSTPVPGSAPVTRPALADYLHRALGYSLTGSVQEQVMFIAVGGGSNGKSILLDTLARVAGDYCENIPPAILMASKNAGDAERASPVASRLAGARAAISSESKDGQRLDAALIKSLTGDATMLARQLHGPAFVFEITHKLWLQTNHKPRMDHLDDAVRGRMHIIPFDMRWNRPSHTERDPSIPDGDKELLATLREEAEGILAWIVRGAVSYHRNGLTPPAEVVSMTQDYFKGQDSFRMWLETCEPCDPKEGHLSTRLYNEYTSWCLDNGFAQGANLTSTAFGLRMGKEGIPKAPDKMGTRYGLRALTGTDLAGGDPLLT